MNQQGLFADKNRDRCSGVYLGKACRKRISIAKEYSQLMTNVILGSAVFAWFGLSSQVLGRFETKTKRGLSSPNQHSITKSIDDIFPKGARMKNKTINK